MPHPEHFFVFVKVFFGVDDGLHLSCPIDVIVLFRAGEKGGRKCVAARSVDSRANKRFVTWSNVFNISISDSTLAGAHSWLGHVNAQSIACAFNRETKFVTLSPSDCRSA